MRIELISIPLLTVIASSALRSALSAQNAHRLMDAALVSAQDAAEYLLAAEMQLGEIIVLMPDGHSRGKATMKRKEPPGGINKKQCKT